MQFYRVSSGLRSVCLKLFLDHPVLWTEVIVLLLCSACAQEQSGSVVNLGYSQKHQHFFFFSDLSSSSSLAAAGSVGAVIIQCLEAGKLSWHSPREEGLSLCVCQDSPVLC